ncbi:MAG: flagellar biosynthesis anti-sigma factor FlgM [Vicinamibacterales bacterium]
MKIEGNRPSQETSAAQRLEGNQSGRNGRAVQNGASSGDRVRVSAEGELVASALRAAGKSPEIRQDVVDRARQALAAGEVGKDAGRLADSLIDHLLSR